MWTNLIPCFSIFLGVLSIILHNCSVGNYISLRRRQLQDADNGYVYSFSHYVKELEAGEAMDPEHSNRENIELALQNMIKTSDALQMVR